MNGTSMKVGTRLALCFSSICFLLLIIIAISLSRLSDLNAGTSQIIQDRWPKIELANDILERTDVIAISLRNMLLSESKDDRQKQIDAILDARKLAGADMSKLETLITAPKGKALFQQVNEWRAKYLAGQDKMIALVNQEQMGEAKAYLNAELRPVLSSYKASLKGLIKFQVELIETSGRDASESYAQARTLILALGLLTVLLAAAIGVFITRKLLNQLGGEPEYAMVIASRIAAGDLGSEIELRPGDQTSLLHAMRKMRDNLVAIVTQVRQGTDAIVSASTQIATGNLDLSSRTEEQASSLEETASSMEELTSTVKQNADNARQANGLTATASNVALKGGSVVSQVVETMGSINDSSKKIVDIIGVIDGIAFQTNILALNAAVEAARAGEQGRGFAVVASEVRNLAQRSAAAAKEIKALIDDSVGKVEVGSKLVNEAGATMQEVVDSVKRVTDIMAEISAASTEQSAGIDQVNQAIGQMDQVTQQNAALVEEASAAAEAMQDQAAKLAQVVSAFKLDGRQAQAVTRPPVKTSTAPAAGKRVTATSRKTLSAPNGTSRLPAHAASDGWEEF